jgi:hypothetical protein
MIPGNSSFDALIAAISKSVRILDGLSEILFSSANSIKFWNNT